MSKILSDEQAREAYERFLDGDGQAIDKLADAYHEKITAFLESLVGNHETAEDLAIDCFSVLLTDRTPMRTDAAFQTFLFSIGKNLAFMHLRRAKKHSYEPLDEYIEETTGISAEDEFMREAQREHVRVSLRKLRADHRCVLHLLFFDEMSYAEAAYVMGKSEGQIRGLTYRAKQALKRILLSEGFSYADNG